MKEKVSDRHLSNRQIKDDRPKADEINKQVYFIGPRYHHHSSYSGYESFYSYVGTALKSSVKERFFAKRLGIYPVIGDLGWRIDQMAAAFTPRPLYSLGVFAIEATTGLHMLTHRKSIYHAIYGDSDVWLLGYIKHFTGNRLVATFHEPGHVLEWLAIDKIAANLDGAILVSESQREFFEQFMPSERIFVVPHGINTDFFRPAPRLSDEPICITVGSKHRDFETLERAMKSIWQVNPNVRLVAIGTRRLKDSNPIFQFEDERIQYLEGASDEQLLQMYQQARVAVLSLFDATANNALLEAMACGLPIVITDVGGIREYLNEDSGFLCSPYNAEQFAQSVLRLLDDPSLAEQMSLAVRSRALEFDYRVVAEQMDKVYSEILMREP